MKAQSLPRWRVEGPLLLLAFWDLFGFGMLIPDIQLRAEALGASGLFIGLILSSMAIVQVAMSPFWGRLSDKVGRKPILIICTLLSATSMLIYGLAGNLIVILISRIFAGLGAANVAIGQAYLSHVTDEESRSGAMGRFGAAISAGLIVGPSLGGFLAHWGGNHLLGFTACGASLLGAITIWIILPHTQTPKEDLEDEKPKRTFAILKELPVLRSMFLIVFISWFSLAMLEGTFGRLIKHNLGFGQLEFGIIFSYESAISVLVQAVIVALLSKRLKDRSSLAIAYTLQGIGLGLTPFAPSLAALLAVGTFYAFGVGVSNPIINSLCSKLTPDNRQGELFGLLQSSRSIGYIVGPALGGMLFDYMPGLPYFISGVVCFIAALVVIKFIAKEQPSNSHH